MHRHTLHVLTALAAASLAIAAASAQPAINWTTISAGGEVSGANASYAYTLTSVIGQPAAGATLSAGSYSLTGGFITSASSPRTCTADFDGDGDTGTDADIEAFFACLAGGCCSTCASADFNGDGDTGTDADIESFFRVLGGARC